MNSEELENSLRTEFETYLKNVLAEVRQEASEFQTKIEAEFDQHKAQFSEAFAAFSMRFNAETDVGQAFKSSVTEHLRLARDEGAKIAANAMAEAEKMQAPAGAAPAPRYDSLRDAVNAISGKDSQSAILKELVERAAEFAARGAFFIVKSEHLVGWKVFGSDDASAEQAVRDIHLPISDDAIICDAVRSLHTVDGSGRARSADHKFLEPIGFGNTDGMYAIPLVARGRGVAVLYVDRGNGGADVNLEALETLTRVAAITVELLAASQTAREENRSVGPADFEDAQHDHDTAPPAESYEPSGSQFEMPAQETPVIGHAEPESPGFAFGENSPFETGYGSPAPYRDEAPPPAPLEQGFETIQSYDAEIIEDVPQVVEPAPEPQRPTYVSPFDERPGQVAEPSYHHEAPAAEEQTPAFQPAAAPQPVTERPFPSDAGYGLPAPVQPPNFGQAPQSFDKPATDYQPSAEVNGAAYGRSIEPAAPVVEAPVAPAAPAPKARFSDRPVDLPIDVPEEERRPHNDARRFARLLVSEIKLYNEKKVLEGRQAHDLYDRLKEAIDRSREMYDKRVQPPVAAKFDYFHYELLNALADGDAARLGSNYPGARV